MAFAKSVCHFFVVRQKVLKIFQKICIRYKFSIDKRFCNEYNNDTL